MDRVCKLIAEALKLSSARRGAVKLYADFFHSDVIMASPTALATKQAGVDGKSDQDLDFLSSIDNSVAARCDVMQMENQAYFRTGSPHFPLQTKNSLPITKMSNEEIAQ